ncbi:MAG: energy transducer TonB [Bacteroidales bacterium]|nr:energy transducer TonB [Bacteroidales bacterium]
MHDALRTDVPYNHRSLVQLACRKSRKEKGHLAGLLFFKTPMKFIPALFLLLFLQGVAFPQAENGKLNPDSVYTFVDELPVFPGGVSALSDYLSWSLVYPEQALRDSLEGKIYVGFVVEADGSISNVKIKKSGGEAQDAEALRMVKNMLRWSPGMQTGKPVRVKLNLPIKFTLQGGVH